METERPIRVLIVDDDEDMRLLVKVVLENNLPVPVETTMACDGNEAVTVYESFDGAGLPDVIVLDNHLPGRLGLEVATMIFEKCPDQTIVVFSAFVTPALRKVAQEMGIAGVLTKSDLEYLPELIDELTGS